MILLWSSGHWGLALKMGAEGSDEQRLRFLSFWIRLSALRIGTLYIFTYFMFLDPPGTNSASFKFGQPQRHALCFAASFSTKGCRGVLLSDSPKAHSMITNAAFTPTSTAGDVNRTTHACTGLRARALQAACCKAAPKNEVSTFKFYSQQRYCSHLFFGDTILHI